MFVQIIIFVITNFLLARTVPDPQSLTCEFKTENKTIYEGEEIWFTTKVINNSPKPIIIFNTGSYPDLLEIYNSSGSKIKYLGPHYDAYDLGVILKTSDTLLDRLYSEHGVAILFQNIVGPCDTYLAPGKYTAKITYYYRFLSDEQSKDGRSKNERLTLTKEFQIQELSKSEKGILNEFHNAECCCVNDRGESLRQLLELLKKYPKSILTPQIMKSTAISYRLIRDYNNNFRLLMRIVDEYPNHYIAKYAIEKLQKTPVEDFKEKESFFRKYYAQHPNAECVKHIQTMKRLGEIIGNNRKAYERKELR